MLESILTTIISFTVGGLIFMLIGFYTLKYFVRMIMKEIFDILKERVIEGSGSTSSKTKKTKKSTMYREDLMRK